MPPTPSPVIANALGGSNSRMVHVTRLRMPFAPATPTIVVPTVSSSGSSERHPWCIVIQSPREDRSATCCQASPADIGRDRDSSSLAISECSYATTQIASAAGLPRSTVTSAAAPAPELRTATEIMPAKSRRATHAQS